jgi:hypothetical protein
MIRSGILPALISLRALGQSGTFTAAGNMSVPRKGGGGRACQHRDPMTQGPAPT